MYQTVLITGAGGSIGSELLRQVIKKKVTKNIIINDLSEYALFQCIQDVNSFEEPSPQSTSYVTVAPPVLVVLFCR